MTSQQQLVFERLTTSIQKCRVHVQRLNYAIGQTNELFPLTLEKYQLITDADIGNIDQLVFRFTKLQDELGANTFRLLLEHLQEDIVGKPFRDILHMLERLNIIDSSDNWLALRELRNDLTHDYPTMMDQTIDKLNHLFLQLPLLENMLAAIEKMTKE